MPKGLTRAPLRERALGVVFGLARGPFITALIYAVLIVGGAMRMDQPGEIRGGLTSAWMAPLIADLVPATQRVAIRTFASSVEGRPMPDAGGG